MYLYSLPLTTVIVLTFLTLPLTAEQANKTSRNSPTNGNRRIESLQAVPKGAKRKTRIDLVGGRSKQFPYDGYEFLKGLGVYRLYMKRTSWAEAYFKCRDDEAHLAVINSEAEALALGSLFDKVPRCCDPTFNYAFVGFHDSFLSRKFLTIDGLSLEEAGYAEFAPEEPDNASTEKCGGMTRNGLLMDLNCSAELFFICEKTFT